MQRDIRWLAYLGIYAFTAAACSCNDPSGCSGSGCSSGGSGCSDASFQECTDNDEDGFTSCSNDTGFNYGDDDCNDRDPTVFPGADEWCDGEDDDCDGTIDDNAVDYEVVYVDDDNDGFGTGAEHFTCNNPGGYAETNDDCDDRNATTFPGSSEVCDGEDNDCDGEIDDSVTTLPVWYADNDGDGAGDPASTAQQCEAPEGYVATADDCDDANSALAPSHTELCANGLDDDCLAATVDTCSYTFEEVASVTLGGAYGHREEERAATSVASAGDVDSDGFDDVLVGNPGAGAAPPGVYLLQGPISGWSSLADARGHLETGDATDLAGTSVAGAGDVDGDGHPDVLFGAPEATLDSNKPGAVWLLYGPDLADCSPFCDGAVLYGPSDGARAGYAVAGAGDTDGDGLDDIVVGAPYLAGGGAALFVDAPTGSLTWADAGATWTGDAGNAGSMVLSAGDIDGDGYTDVGIIDQAGGRLWVATDRPAGEQLLADTAVHIEIPVGDGSLASVVCDDLDGDSVIDVLASATRSEATATDAVAWGSFGPLAGAFTVGDVVLSTEYVYANAGVRLTSVGDIDFDGSADLAMVALGASALLPPDYLTKVETAPTLWFRTGPLLESTSLGSSTTRIQLDGDATPFAGGDVNGDLRPDVLLGDPADTTGGTDAGAVRVLSGEAFL